VSGTFLKAEWRKLAMANYAVPASLLQDYIPAKTEVDLWKGTCYVSLVGFMFLNTLVRGIKIPFHVNFEEVNLRFYVVHEHDRDWRRGVVFIKEIVPRPALTLVANALYKENYQTMPMDHRWEVNDRTLVEYRWKKHRWHSLQVEASTTSHEIAPGSDEEFITEHFWGYTRVGEGKTAEYRVEHPRWQVYPVHQFNVDVDFGNVYGPEFEFLSRQKPVSVFLAEGSPVEVKTGAFI
jgi:uncharacterized protein YqjF (DUF2071 family)